MRSGSPALDLAAHCTYLSSGTNPLFTNGAAITVDQFGNACPLGPKCDAGAVESGAAPTPTPTATFTPTETVTPTFTPTETFTSTFTPTETPVFNTERLVNGSFELDTNGNGIPRRWTRVNSLSDKRKCNTLEKVVAFKGQCAYQFKSSDGVKSKLEQTIDVSVVAPLAVDTGDTLLLTGQVSASGMGVNTRVQVTVKYVDTALPTEKVKVTTTAATAGYIAINAPALVLDGVPSSIKVILQNSGSKGKVRYDAMSLQLQDGTALIALP